MLGVVHLQTFQDPADNFVGFDSLIGFGISSFGWIKMPPGLPSFIVNLGDFLVTLKSCCIKHIKMLSLLFLHSDLLIWCVKERLKPAEGKGVNKNCIVFETAKIS